MLKKSNLYNYFFFALIFFIHLYRFLLVQLLYQINLIFKFSDILIFRKISILIFLVILCSRIHWDTRASFSLLSLEKSKFNFMPISLTKVTRLRRCKGMTRSFLLSNIHKSVGSLFALFSSFSFVDWLNYWWVCDRLSG